MQQPGSGEPALAPGGRNSLEALPACAPSGSVKEPVSIGALSSGAPSEGLSGAAADELAIFSGGLPAADAAASPCGAAPDVAVDVADERGFSFGCLLYTSPSPRDGLLSRMPSSA